MAITYTEHAKERMKYRGIATSEVEETILQPYSTVPSMLGRVIAVKKYGDKYLKPSTRRATIK